MVNVDLEVKRVNKGLVENRDFLALSGLKGLEEKTVKTENQEKKGLKGILDHRDLEVTKEKPVNVGLPANQVNLVNKVSADLLVLKGLEEKTVKTENLDVTGNLVLRVKKGILGNKAFLVLRVILEKMEKKANAGSKDLKVNAESKGLKANAESKGLKANAESKDLKANVGSKGLKANAESKDLKANVGSKGLVERILPLPQIQCHNQCLTLHLSQWILNQRSE